VSCCCRTLHRIPELAFEEERTSAYLRQQLKALDIPFRHPVARTGIVATLGFGTPRFALRSDIDALPITVRGYVNSAGWDSGEGEDVHFDEVRGDMGFDEGGGEDLGQGQS